MHDDFTIQRWQVFVSYLICVWLCVFLILFANKILPMLEQLGGFLVIAGFLLTVIVCAVMPKANETPYASSAFVWTEWTNDTGYSSSGFAFCLGMLNGAFAVGTPDVVSHLAEEIPRYVPTLHQRSPITPLDLMLTMIYRPSVNIPKAILAQFIIGFFTAFFYLIAIFYGINNLNNVLTSTYLFPLTEIYRQATGSRGGSLGLLILAFLPSIVATLGCFITASRVFWTLARDNATPFSPFFGRVNHRHRNPFNSILLCGVIATVLGCIYVGSATAFSAFVGSFIILSTLSYLMAILPHLLSGRSNVTPGWFWMKGITGYIVNALSCLYIIVFVIIFCFPFSMPVAADTMNYACLITGGLTIFTAVFWFVRQKDYVGPQPVSLGSELLAKDAI